LVFRQQTLHAAHRQWTCIGSPATGTPGARLGYQLYVTERTFLGQFHEAQAGGQCTCGGYTWQPIRRHASSDKSGCGRSGLLSPPRDRTTPLGKTGTEPDPSHHPMKWVHCALV